MYYQVKKLITLIIRHTFLLSIALSCIMPFLWMINVSFKSHDEFDKGYTQKSEFSPEKLKELTVAGIVKDLDTNENYVVWNYASESSLRYRLSKLGISGSDKIIDLWQKSRDYGLKPVIGFTLRNYKTVIFDYKIWKFFLNSVFYTFFTVFLIVIISSLAAFGFSRLQFPGKNVIFFMFLAAMMIPLPAGFVPVFVLLHKIHMVNRAGYVLAMTNMGLSLSIYLLKTFFDQLPRDLEDAARIDGCSKLQIWWNVGLPLVAPALAVVIIFNALTVWNDFVLASLLFTNENLMPLQVGLMDICNNKVTKHTLSMAALTIAALPIILLYLKMQKQFVKGLTAGAVVG